LKGRPVLYVLAGVNGAGKSSIGGYRLQQAGMDWFNPDTFARELMTDTGCGQADANSAAWQEGMRRLDAAMKDHTAYAFETTLGGHTVPLKIAEASRTHDVLMWFCGLSSPEKHIARVQARVAVGGHDIPEAKIRERYVSALENLLALMPSIAVLQVYDNSVDVARGEAIPDPLLIAEIVGGTLVQPTDLESLRRTPNWAKPLLAAALPV
jgi:predicted ABC-type ATPase